MSRIHLTNMHYNAYQIVCSSPHLAIRFFDVMRLRVRCVRKHTELERELYRCIDLDSPLISALFVFKPLPIAY